MKSFSLSCLLALTASMLSLSIKAEVSKLTKYDLDFRSVCSVKVTAEGDVYALGYIDGDRHSLAYRVLKNNLQDVFRGEIRSPTGSEVSCENASVIIPGYHDNFFTTFRWRVDHSDSGNDPVAGVYNIKFKENQSELLFSKENSHLDKFFFDNSMSILYTSMYPNHSNDRLHTTVAAFDVNAQTQLWEKDFLFASQGSLLSPDNTRMYLIGREKSQLISLPDQRVINEGPSLITGFKATIDNKGNVYAGRVVGGEGKLFLARLQPFTSPTDSLTWQIPYSAQLKTVMHDGYSLAPDGMLYVSSLASVAGPGILVIDADSGKQQALIHPPVDENGDRLTFIAPAVFDEKSDNGYTYSSFLAKGYPDQTSEDYIQRYDIWRFSPATQQSEPIFSIKTGNDVSRGFTLINDRIYIVIKDTLYVYDLNQADNEQNKPAIHYVGSDIVSQEEADEGITIQYQMPAASEGKEYYYLFSLNEERTRFGSYQKIKAGSSGEAKVKIHKAWHPHGGEFFIGLADNINRAVDVKEFGNIINITVSP